jgi:tRNA_anti-like
VKLIKLLLLGIMLTNCSFAQKESKPLSDGIPPRPAPPPIPRDWLVKASKLASDFSGNRSLAEKKYKKKYIAVEGIVKEIGERDDYGIMITLDGTPSKIDIQCKVINDYKARNIKKGMKVVFTTVGAELNGNVILSKCMYNEKPAYE